jgi:hypothetical protein
MNRDEALSARATRIEVGGEAEFVAASLAELDFDYETWGERVRRMGRQVVEAAAMTGAMWAGIPYPYRRG